MRESSIFDSAPIWRRRYGIALMATWTLIVAAALLWNLSQDGQAVLEVARTQARAAFDKDLLYRQWAMERGSIYVPVSDATPPNQFLAQQEERDITTPSGRRLTLVAPATITRQVLELGEEEFGLRGRMTSLDSMDPSNQPDPWEADALRAFDAGQTEVSSVEALDGARHLRLMRPLLMTTGCLRCHREESVELGDVLGGISVSVPMKPLESIARGRTTSMIVGLGVVWLLGIGGIGLAGQSLERRCRENGLAQRKYREQGEFLRACLESLTSPFFVVTATDYSVIMANSAALGGMPLGLVARCAARSLPDAANTESQEPCPLAMCRTTGEPVTVEQVDCDPQGDIRTVEIHCYPVRGRKGDVAKIIVHTFDITRRKRAEESRNAIHAKLQRAALKLRDRNRDLKRANAEIEAFVYSASHDLRSPLINLQGFTDRLDRRLQEVRECLNPLGPDPAEQARQALGVLDGAVAGSVRHITYSVQKFEAVIDGLLNLSRTGREELHPAVIDMEELVERVLIVHQETISQKQVSVSVGVLPAAIGDANAIDRVLSNLVSNALKYLDPRRPGMIEIGCAGKQGLRHRFYVRDNGIGIERRHHERIFRIFQRLQVNEAAGEGLGLAVVKKIIERHGGRISLESEPGVGSRFVFTLRSAPALVPASVGCEGTES